MPYIFCQQANVAKSPQCGEIKLVRMRRGTDRQRLVALQFPFLCYRACFLAF